MKNIIGKYNFDYLSKYDTYDIQIETNIKFIDIKQYKTFVYGRTEDKKNISKFTKRMKGCVMKISTLVSKKGEFCVCESLR
jgi:hypothetical protein